MDPIQVLQAGCLSEIRVENLEKMLIPDLCVQFHG